MASTEYSKHLDELEKIHHKTVDMLSKTKPLDMSAITANHSPYSVSWSMKAALILTIVLSVVGTKLFL